MSCEVQVPKPKLVPSLGLSEPYIILLFSAVRLVKQTSQANEAIASESAERKYYFNSDSEDEEDSICCDLDILYVYSTV